MDLPAPISLALKMLEEQGFEAFVVGGCVRDSLMEASPKDFDIATNALPSEVKEVFRDFQVIETGIVHGTVTVIVESIPVEITTYRIDGKYTDSRRPTSVEFTNSIIDDLSRRDFTINAMAYSSKTGLVDPFNGHKDLDDRMIRCVGDPAKRFGEDALRILRAVRFASVFGFEIDAGTKAALLDQKDTILKIAVERITSEFSRMICGQNIENVLSDYVSVLTVFMPELRTSIRFSQKTPFHIYDVYSHTVKVVANTPPSLALRLAALFHDIAKPVCYTEDIKGAGHFYGHSRIGAEMTKKIMDRMKFSNDIKKRTIDLVSYHDVFIKADPKTIKRLMNRFSREFFIDLITLKKADMAGQAPGQKDREAHLDRLLEIYESIIKDNGCFSLKELAINGEDLLLLGISGGKQIGAILKDCLDMVISDKIQNKRSDLIEYVLFNYGITGINRLH